MKFFDTHAHLNDERFDNDRDLLIESLSQHEISKVMDVACDVRYADKTIAIIDKYDFIYAAVGMHPHEAAETKISHMDDIELYTKNSKVKAIGEIGLDYYYDFAPKEMQKKWFATQLELAQQLHLPVILHIRDAFGDCMDILRAHKNGLSGVMHCYSGSLESAYECINLGLYIAFGGSVTFNNAANLATVAANIPLERILLETDCPYLTPVPHRGKRNDPTYIKFTAEKIAGLRNMDVEDLASITYNNANSAFDITD